MAGQHNQAVARALLGLSLTNAPKSDKGVLTLSALLAGAGGFVRDLLAGESIWSSPRTTSRSGTAHGAAARTLKVLG